MDPYVFYSKRGNKQIRRGNYIYVTYKNVPRDLSFKHVATNDYNQHLCGGWSLYKHPPFEEVDRVTLGLKPVGISHTRDLLEAEVKQKEIINKGFMATVMKSTWNDLYFITASPHGTLQEFFPNLDDLIKDYQRIGLTYDADAIEKYKNVKFDTFHGGRYDVKDHPSCIVGLILGYPIENTVAIIRGDIC